MNILLLDIFATGLGYVDLCVEKKYNFCHLLSANAQQILADNKNIHAKEWSEHYNEMVVPKVPKDKLLTESSYSSFEQMVDDLKQYNFDCVVAGFEDSVVLADTIATFIGVKNVNNYKTTPYRNNKHLMQKGLKEHGVNYIPYIFTDDVEQIKQWFTENKFTKIVLKGPRSASSDGVFICHNHEEIENYFVTIRKERNIFNKSRTKLLAEQYIDGEHYMVNSIIHKDIIHIDTVIEQKFEEKNSMFFYHDDILRDFLHNDKYSQMLDYNTQVLKALGFEFGVAHAEYRIMNGVPYLIEIAGRVMGGPLLANKNYQKLIGYNPFERIVRSYSSADEFKKSLVGHNASTDNISFLAAPFPKTGKFKTSPVYEIIKNHPGLLWFYPFTPGQDIVKTPADQGNTFVAIIGSKNATEFQKLNKLLNYVFFKEPKYYITYQSEPDVSDVELQKLANKFGL